MSGFSTPENQQIKSISTLATPPHVTFDVAKALKSFSTLEETEKMKKLALLPQNVSDSILEFLNVSTAEKNNKKKGKKEKTLSDEKRRNVEFTKFYNRMKESVSNNIIRDLFANLTIKNDNIKKDVKDTMTYDQVKKTIQEFDEVVRGANINSFQAHLNLGRQWAKTFVWWEKNMKGKKAWKDVVQEIQQVSNHASISHVYKLRMAYKITHAFPRMKWINVHFTAFSEYLSDIWQMLEDNQEANFWKTKGFSSKEITAQWKIEKEDGKVTKISESVNEDETNDEMREELMNNRDEIAQGLKEEDSSGDVRDKTIDEDEESDEDEIEGEEFTDDEDGDITKTTPPKEMEK